MFELVFLGTAAAVPSAERGLPALLVGHGPDRFLVDCGEGTQRQLLRAGLGFRGLRHVLLTHAHLDHVMGLAGLIATRALWGLSGAIEIIGSGETVEFVQRYLAVTVGADANRLSLACGVTGLGFVAAGLAPRRFCGGASRHPEPRLPVRGGSAPPLACRTARGIGRAGRTSAAGAGGRPPGDARRRQADRAGDGSGTRSCRRQARGCRRRRGSSLLDTAGPCCRRLGHRGHVSQPRQRARPFARASDRRGGSLAGARGGGRRAVADPYIRSISARGHQRGSRRHFSSDSDRRRFRPHLGRRALCFRKDRHLSLLPPHSTAPCISRTLPAILPAEPAAQ